MKSLYNPYNYFLSSIIKRLKHQIVKVQSIINS